MCGPIYRPFPRLACSATRPSFGSGSSGTPEAIVDRLNREITRFIKSDFMQKRLASQGARAIGTSRDEFAAFMRTEQEKWGRVLREIQIKPE